MISFKDLWKFYLEGGELYWNDPQPIEGNSYKITYIENLEDFDDVEDRLSPILI